MRLVTRSDFDGLACAVLLKEKKIINDYMFAHPKDLQDGLVSVGPNDVLANVPYVPGCGMWFDHHTSEYTRLGKIDVPGDSCPLPSCARVIWRYYGGHESFPEHFDTMMEAVDRIDSGQLKIEEIKSPKDWVMLGFIMDPRTGLGRYRDYRISNYQLMEALVEYCRSMEVKDILELPDIKERSEVYWRDFEPFINMIKENSKLYGRLLVTDLREQPIIYAGNRFLAYSIFPECNISMRVMWGLKRRNVVITLGYSVLNHTCSINVGELMLKYGGGGHRQVGTCQVPEDKFEQILQELIETIVKTNG